MSSNGRVRPGQNIATAFSARAWNRAQDAADLVLAQKLGTAEPQANGFSRAPTIITIQNISGEDVGRFGVLGIDRPVVDPSESAYAERSFQERPVLRCILPALPADTNTFVVCIEPIKHNQFGRAVIAGMFACKVRVNDPAHQFATARTNDVSQLQTTTCGPVLLLWKNVQGLTDSTRDNRWAVGVL